MRALAAIIALAACASGHGTVKPAYPDAPIQLRDDADRDQAIDELAATPAGPARDAARAKIADAIGRRLGDALDEDQPLVAELLLAQLAELWQDEPAALGKGLSGQAAVLHRARDAFAKAGESEPALTALVMLAETEPDHRAKHMAEIDEILAYADELAIAENGANAGRAQPISLLQPTALAVPLPWVVDRYVTLLVERANTIQAVMDREGATAQLVRAHADIVRTSHRIANVLARAGRANEIHGVLERVHGVGNLDKDLQSRAAIVAEQPTPSAYVALARTLRVIDKGSSTSAADPRAALGACLTGLARFPNDASLLAAAAEHAQALGRVAQPIALYERALKATNGDVEEIDALRLGRLYSEAIARLAMGGRPDAATAAWQDIDRSTRTFEKAHPQPAWGEAMAGAQTALGRGLIAQGQLAKGERALTSSLARSPTFDAYEALATVDLQTDHYESATKWVDRGIAILGDSSGDHFRRAKLERLSGDALRRLGKSRQSAERYLDSLRSWASLGDCRELPRNICGERMLESGRVMWWLGESSRSIDLVMHAIDVDADTPTTAAGAVAFLVEVGKYSDAVEAYHRALGSSEVGEYYKTYMGLWIVGEAKRRNEAPDRLAMEYLGSRHGDLWYEQLAQAAAGKATLDKLTASANTGPRKAELAFYTVTLGLDPKADRTKLLAAVIEAGLVMDAEYDLARMYLAQR